jgi:hypothetical protein
MGREQERFQLTDEPILLCNTAHDRTPFISNTGDSPIMLDIAKWPMTHGLTLQPGATTAFPNPMTQFDATPIFAKAPGGKGEVEYLFLR